MATIKIKLAVDRTQNRVLFTDAGSDFVDVLLSFLTLPLSAVQFCSAAATSSPGCLYNLCGSVINIRESKLLMVGSCHRMLLTPSQEREFGTYGPKERFVISDGWTIKPVSTSTMQSLPHNFTPDAILQEFEEMEVCVGWAEVVSILKASLSSHTIFTNVFLSKGTGDQPAGRVTVKKKIMHRANKDSESDSSPQSNIKLFYDRQEKKVMYAECKHEFVDLLLGFLSYPLGCVIKNMADGAVTCPLGDGGFENLYISTIELEASGFITDGYAEKMLLNPSLCPFSTQCFVLEETYVEPEPEEFCMGLAPYRSSRTFLGTCRNCHPNLVDDRKYVIDDDLQIHQASAMAVSKHWCRRDKANVVEMEITTGIQEVVVLLRAVLTSKTALTDVFISRLEEPPALTNVKVERK
ncbi:uncharacterized protein LOC119292979 [Triticum dicoccoides]|uniref:uncharacterized protein LOC119292979 n=1 Tax=Triticum dicoccoides TaxID=85692 RepID=UPI00188FA851|nr:uncharacterized protein LOC119292979 [Triticum dicoccoides]